jgi:1-acyl-sn-glycerol-3-phosphate acyltransferase
MDQWEYRPARDFGLPLRRRLLSVRRENGLVSSLTRHAWWIGSGLYLRSYHRLVVRGREHLPARPPFIMIANHASHLDIMLLAAGLPMRFRECAYPIAAGDTFFETPARRLFSWMMLSALPMWRKGSVRHAIDDLRTRLLENPVVYLLFPEGTRTRTGDMSAFRPGLGMLVAGTEIPVVPCRIEGAFRSLPPGSFVPRPYKLHLTIAPPMCFPAIANDRAGWKRIAGELEQVIRGPSATPEA